MAGDERLHVIRVFPGQLVPAIQSIAISIKITDTAKEVIAIAFKKLNIHQDCDSCELVEVCYRDSILVHQSEHVLAENDLPAEIQLSWNNLRPRQKRAYRFFLRVKPKSDLEGPLRYHWMDCHEGVVNSTVKELNFELDFKLQDDDLCKLPNLDEETLLGHLKERFKQGRIYTYVGEILIAVNPFRFFPIYNPKFINAYNNKNLGSLPPHIFAIADVAYHRMLREKKSQCVVISGESGSGKTESTKLLVHHLTALSHKTQASAVETTILGVGPVLEAFGNAKTAYNNNSSRFGKFTQIKFREDGTVSGAALRKYLLEKSRIVSQAPEERNYHVFYYLLAGATPADREELHLMKPQDYFYLNQGQPQLGVESTCTHKILVRFKPPTIHTASECYTIDDGIDEGYEFLRLRQSMDMVGFTPDIQKRIFGILSAVLHIGNLQLARKPGQEDCAVIVEENEHLEIVCKMLMVTRENLVSVLTTRKSKTRGEEFIVTYKYEEALATRDAMAKALYGTLFDWIVLQVNHVLLLKQQSAKEFRSIGVLDIFGFEDFAHNSYEQFCINFANEKLQKYFNHHIFKLEQDEYFAEGIEWRNVHYVDNSACLELIAGKPTGLLNLIDEESNFPGATESSLLAKVNKTHSCHKFYESFLMEDAFVVKHYAGSVKYDIKGFLDKNRDLMRPDILRALKNSSLRFVRELLGADPVAVYRWAIVRTFFKAVHAFKVSGKLYRLDRASDAGIKARKRLSKHLRKTMLSIEDEAESASLFRKASRVIRRMQSSKNGQKPIQPLSKWRHDLETKRDMAGKAFDYLYRNPGPRGKAAPKNPPTVSAQFQSSLNRLMEILSEAQPFFVRCVRSNAEKAPLMFDPDVVLRQLRYTGMLETVRIRKLGYPWRFAFEEFFKSYSLLFPKEVQETNFPDKAPRVLKSLGLDQQEYQIGKSKIFLRESQHKELEDRLQRELIRNVCIIQRWTRAVLQRRNFLRQRSAAATIQAGFRCYVVRQEYVRKLWAATKIQSMWRMYQRQQRYDRLLQGTVLLQTHARGYLARKKFARLVRERERTRNDYLNQMNERIEREKRYMVRSLSDPSNFEKIKLSRLENNENDKPTWKSDDKGIDLEENEIKSAKEKDDKRMQEVWQLGDKANINHISEKLLRNYRSASDPSIRRPQSMRISRPTPLQLIHQHAEEEKGLVPDVHLLHPGRSPLPPETRSITVNDSLVDSLLTDEQTCGSFSKRVRRRLSSRAKGKPSQRASTSMIDDISSSAAATENENLSPLPSVKPGADRPTTPRIATLPVTLSSTERDTRKTKKKFFRKMSRNSFRRKSEPGLQQHAVKKLIEMEKKKESNSTEDLTEALGQTKIVSTVSRAAIIPGTLQWKSTGRRIVKGPDELVELDSFLMTKISLLNKEDHKRDTIVDRVFRKALQEFHSHLISTYSVMKDHDDSLFLKYEDLSGNFENILNKIIKRERISASFPVIMGVNAFGGVLDEFLITRSQARNKPSKPRKPFKKRKSGERVTQHNGHKFAVAQFSIHTFCEHCNYLIWVLEKGMVCQECRFTCHKKCYQKSAVICRKSRADTAKDGATFGGSLTNLVSEELSIPTVVDKLIQEIEGRGLYTEGIYRKSPSAAAVKKLKNSIVTSGIENVDLSPHPVHVVAGVLKLFFRQLGHPLITDDLYMEFVRTSELTEERVKYQTLYNIVQRLPKPNRDTLERLIFHLARLETHSESNLMNSNALAIIWSPCILRTPEYVPPLESFTHVTKQTQCLETLISGQAAKMKATLGDIRVLEKAADTANKRLSLLEMQDEQDEGMVEKLLEGNGDSEEKRLLTEQLETLELQKAELTAELSTLEPHSGLKNMEGVDGMSSSEDLTDDDIDRDAAEEYAVTFGLPAAPVQLTHLTKNRATRPTNKKPPSRARLKENAFRSELSQSPLWVR